MRDEADFGAEILQFAENRIDQEGHVVVEDLDQRHGYVSPSQDIRKPDQVLAGNARLGERATRRSLRGDARRRSREYPLRSSTLVRAKRSAAIAVDSSARRGGPVPRVRSPGASARS